MNEPSPSQPPLAVSRILTWWFGLMSSAGALSGVFLAGRPPGDDMLDHPLVVVLGVTGVGLLVFRFAWRRPVAGAMPDGVLLIGWCAGLAAFLVGNWLATHLLAMR
jgi:hypothetical protein